MDERAPVARLRPVPPAGASTLGNLPVAVSSLIGRDAAVTEVAELLSESRLLTLVGPGGSGKTRLALEVATRDGDRFPDGTWWVDLAVVTEPALVSDAVASALELSAATATTGLDGLIDQLRHRRLLLVLDNCEHLADACADLTLTVLQRCRHVRLMATSRHVLDVDGETVYPVPALDVPPADAATTDDARAFASVALFEERARMALPSFTVDRRNVDAVSRICRRLEGLPLGVELAAARVRTLSPAEIAGTIDDRLLVLQGGQRAGGSRHRTMEACLEWSYQLLTDDERTALEHLTVFSAPFTRDGADALVGGDGDGTRDLLDSLVDKSLVHVVRREPTMRFRLLDTTRRFAAAKLAERDGVTVAKERLLGRYVEMATEISTGGRRYPPEELRAELDNVWTALEWAVTSDAADQGLHVAGAWMGVLLGRRYVETRRLLGRLLDATQATPDVRSKVLVGAGMLGCFTGDYGAARELAEEAVALARGAGDDRRLADALPALALALYIVDPPQAEAVSEQAIGVAEAVGDTPSLVRALAEGGITRGTASWDGGEEELLSRSRTLAEETGNAVGLVRASFYRGVCCTFKGALEDAEADLTRALRTVERFGDDPFATWLQTELAHVAILRGRHAEAAELLDGAVTAARTSGARPVEALASCYRGLLAYARGEVSAAVDDLEEAVAWCRQRGHRPWTAMALSILASAVVATGERDRASALVEDARDVARAVRFPWAYARAVLCETTLARADGAIDRAAAAAHEALAVADRCGDAATTVDALEALAGVAAVVDSRERAARLFAATERFRDDLGYATFAPEQARRDADVALLRGTMDASELDRAWEQGRALDRAGAVAYAQRGQGERARPSVGWGALTPTELEVVRLVAEGLSNPEIAQRLFVTRNTVKTHLSHVFTKVGVSTRAELAAEAGRRGMSSTP